MAERIQLLEEIIVDCEAAAKAEENEKNRELEKIGAKRKWKTIIKEELLSRVK